MIKLHEVFIYFRRLKWIFLKILTFLYLGLWKPFPSDYYSKEKFPEILLIFCVGFISSILLIAIQSANPYSSSHWQKPSLNSNPYNMKEPIQAFHFLSVCVLVVGAKIYFLSVYQKIGTLEGARLLSAAIGLYLGVRLSILIFKQRLSPNQDKTAV
jgi:hypothetical protein